MEVRHARDSDLRPDRVTFLSHPQARIPQNSAAESRFGGHGRTLNEECHGA